MPIIALIAALSAMSGQPSYSNATSCAYDEDMMLALGINAFDQDGRGGWRELASRPGCKDEAADLIEVYRTILESRLTTLYWHEGQLRAELGQIDAAITAFERARHDDNLDGWNFYVDATIAFLRKDKPALLQARAGLASVPVPEGYTSIGLDGRRVTGRPAGWPFNLDVVDGLINCFGKTYDVAYAASCRKPGVE